MQYKQFNSVSTDLESGVNLIEASAGTGKTYAIAMLALRFIVEKGIAIDELLIVTFTKAATEELKERVRGRLNEARRVFAGASDGVDGNMIAWAEQLDIDYTDAKQRVELALLDIDRAGIFTIHGFCQRVLKEHALESGQLFDVELSSDISAIRQTCGDDFWRREVYPRKRKEVSVLLAFAKTPDDLLRSIQTIDAFMPVYPETGGLTEILHQLFAKEEAAKQSLQHTLKKLQQLFAGKTFNAKYIEEVNSYATELADWFNGENLDFPDCNKLTLFSSDGIAQGLNGSAVPKDKTKTLEQRKRLFFDSLQFNTDETEAFAIIYHLVGLAFRRALYDYMQKVLTERLQTLNVLSFDDLISRLHDSLNGPLGEWLTKELRQRFKAALIDEFQDTDSKQWLIFSKLFADEACYLFLIGDPKQAIYKFRGADIFSYFDAQKKAQHLYTLDKNWRSQPALVAAVNRLFQHNERAFLFEQLSFKPVEPALTEADGALYRQGTLQTPMMIWQLEQSGSKSGYWTSAKAGTEIQSAVVTEILQLLDPSNDIVLQRRGHPATSLAARDIAILVRTHGQARQFQQQLRQVGIPSVINSNESVFAAPEAQSLNRLLQAIAQPGDINRLKQALTLSWFNLDGKALYQLSNDESGMDLWLERFQNYYQQWRTQGLMAMMLKLLQQERLQENVSQCVDAERQLTNLHHLLELLQQAAVDEHLGINKTLEWLRNAITESTKSDEQQLRLESDEQAVKIVTMHSSKGLEYPLVFCPYLWQRNERLTTEKQMIKCHEQGQMIVDLGSEEFERRRKQALSEELAEDLRVLYVAVTRAKYRCYIVWADVRSEKNRNASAMDYLLFTEQESTFAEQQRSLQQLCHQHQGEMNYRALTPGEPVSGLFRGGEETKQLRARQAARQMRSCWQMSSYTALSALSLSDAPELPHDKVQEAVEVEMAAAAADVLPKGAHTGNVVHALLETIDFKTLAAGADISPAITSACLTYGLKLEKPALLQDLLQSTVQTPLSAEDKDFSLANIETKACLKEMPFYLSLDAINTRQINELLTDTPAFQPLTAKRMQGYLTGFIDLVCQYQGRFYVIDYKTNSLPDYGPENLNAAMREHNYALQYWIYTLVLHRYLQQRLPDYAYETHFGGVRYLFVRGMQPQHAMSGVYPYFPDYQRLQSLSELFGGRP